MPVEARWTLRSTAAMSRSVVSQRASRNNVTRRRGCLWYCALPVHRQRAAGGLCWLLCVCKAVLDTDVSMDEIVKFNSPDPSIAVNVLLSLAVKASEHRSVFNAVIID